MTAAVTWDRLLSLAHLEHAKHDSERGLNYVHCRTCRVHLRADMSADVVRFADWHTGAWTACIWTPQERAA